MAINYHIRSPHASAFCRNAREGRRARWLLYRYARARARRMATQEETTKNTSPKELCQKGTQRHAGLATTKDTKSTKKGTQRHLERFCSGPLRFHTRGGAKTNPARVDGQPGPTSRRTRGGWPRRRKPQRTQRAQRKARKGTLKGFAVACSARPPGAGQK